VNHDAEELLELDELELGKLEVLGAELEELEIS
jgi:hypothetical protein